MIQFKRDLTSRETAPSLDLVRFRHEQAKEEMLAEDMLLTRRERTKKLRRRAFLRDFALALLFFTYLTGIINLLVLVIIVMLAVVVCPITFRFSADKGSPSI